MAQFRGPWRVLDAGADLETLTCCLPFFLLRPCLVDGLEVTGDLRRAARSCSLWEGGDWLCSAVGRWNRLDSGLEGSGACC